MKANRRPNVGQVLAIEAGQMQAKYRLYASQKQPVDAAQTGEKVGLKQADCMRKAGR
jgi:hypothetical protein